MVVSKQQTLFGDDGNFAMKSAVHGLTEEQRAVVEKVFVGKEGNLVVQAYAGTGKTHTLCSFAKARPKNRIHYLAFNKSMAVEAAKKFKNMDNVHVMTVHSLAYQEIGKQFRGRLGDINPVMLEPVIQKYCPKTDAFEVGNVIKVWLNGFLSSSYSSVRSYFDKVCTQADEEFFRERNIKVERLIEATKQVWNEIVSGDGLCGTLPMPHNGYLKLYQLEKRQMNSDFVLIDEAQDVTDCMIDIVQNQKANRLYIGDTYQQIYAWNGAVNSLEKLERSGAETLYLTKSFRCPDAVAEIADKYLQILGAKKTFMGNGKQASNDYRNAVLGRSNAAIFHEAYKCVSEGKTPYFLGGFSGYDFEILIDIWRIMSGHPEKIKNVALKELGFQTFDDMCAYADEYDQHLSSRCNLVKLCKGHVVGMYREIKDKTTSNINEADIVFATVHKAKGAEWGRVKLCDDFIDFEKIFARVAGGETVVLRREDLNILYVAATRAKSALGCPQTIVPSSATVETIRRYIKTGKILMQ